ncbi:N-acetyl-gamma-glutamyl-phosphate reductase, partial [Chloroflexota bacterium]
MKSSGRSAAGKKLADVFPHLADTKLVIEAGLGDVDLVFSALPHKQSVAEVIPLLERGVRVV